ncbi:MAG: hypothetical protein PHG85_05535 [Candidatus Altiarchaeota archaeon]|nr:hypothetical protein [Candidatus Altiarchaeota archaeon]
MDRFVKQKKHAVNKLNMSVSVGDADEGIISLLSRINSLGDYYTTSSCAGRIQLFQDVGSKADNQQIACWHRTVKPAEVLLAYRKVSGVLYFKCEPPIIHVAARTVEAAQKLLVAARESGFKHSGIQSVKDERVMVELASTESLDAPVADDKRRLVTDDYIKYLVRLANKKHRRSQEKIRKLENSLKKQPI